jgi:hypothetical protein
MRYAAAVVLCFFAATAQAHPGHGESEVHLHGFNPEMILLALLIAAWLLLRSR